MSAARLTQISESTDATSGGRSQPGWPKSRAQATEQLEIAFHEVSGHRFVKATGTGLGIAIILRGFALHRAARDLALVAIANCEIDGQVTVAIQAG